jgi:GMP synthase (glutamine-hydrolysing)
MSSTAESAEVQRPATERETVLVLDFGSQYAQLIARRVREQRVYSLIVRHDVTAARIREIKPSGIILSGGPASVYAEGAPQCDPEIFGLGIPILGICYGMQLVCRAMGGLVGSSAAGEYGPATCRINTPSDLLAGLPPEIDVWMSHGDQVTDVAADFERLAATETCSVAAVAHRRLPLFGLQFHPEVTHTHAGKRILGNFVGSICGCSGSWQLGDFAREAVTEIAARVGPDRVICGLSGGVDSSVAAAILYRAIGPRLSCILVDNGMLRKDEEQRVLAEFSRHFETDLHVVKAEDRFLDALAGIADPEEKRRRIGHVFIDCFAREAKKIPGARFLAQGTLYPDVIESGAAPDGPADTIKLHHNVGGLPAELGFELIEPLRDLFKDEVRQLGLELGLPDEIVWRHPFPGPGLAVRCLGEVTREKLRRLAEADAIVIDEIKKAGLYRETAQAFAVLLPVRSVGVMGDSRTYESAVCVRCVNSDDFMTADWTRLPYDVLARMSARIINEVKGVNRVAYDISSKPPATIEWE